MSEKVLCQSCGRSHVEISAECPVCGATAAEPTNPLREAREAVKQAREKDAKETEHE